MAKLRIENVVLQFAQKHDAPLTALDGISLEVEEQEFSVIVGPSGCGKSSLLRLVAGLNEPTSGAIYLDGKLVKRPFLLSENDGVVGFDSEVWSNIII